ncbi:hypothetical protein Bfae18676_22800 [Butyricimonas faecihominis]|nr:hypothetical protein Bfae18676_22800 [Butyricimonas faecihominis]
MCQNFDDYEIDFFVNMWFRFFAFCICEGTGSDGDAESGRNVICQCDFGVEETDTIGFLLQL